MKGRRLESEKAGEYNRTTSMLVAVVLCFVVTELPQGVFAFVLVLNLSLGLGFNVLSVHALTLALAVALVLRSCRRASSPSSLS